MAVLVRAPARLHLGFIPPVRTGDSAGSAAVAITPPEVQIYLEKSEDIHVSGPHSDEIFSMALSFMNRFLPGKGVEIEVRYSIRRHAGFGSGTRMAMSVGMGISALYGLDLDPYDLAEFFGRGVNSRAGLESLIHGGIAVVSPRGGLHLLKLPPEWSFIVALPESEHRFYGEKEKRAMSSVKHKEMVGEDLADLLEKSVSAGDIEETGKILDRIDMETGRLFRPIQKGDYSHDDVLTIIKAGKDAGAYAAGQSSWGPAVYFLVDENIKHKVDAAIGQIVGKDRVYDVKMSEKGISIERFDE